MDRKRASKGCSQPGEGKYQEPVRKWKEIEQEELTGWRGQMPELIRTRKQRKAVRETHNMESLRADAGIDQDKETKRSSEGNPLPREGRRRDWSGHGNKAGKQGELTRWRGQTS